MRLCGLWFEYLCMQLPGVRARWIYVLLGSLQAGLSGLVMCFWLYEGTRFCCVNYPDTLDLGVGESDTITSVFWSGLRAKVPW